MKFLAHQLGTLLLKLNVLKMLGRKSATENNEISFRDDMMYQWSCRSEVSSTNNPAKVSNNGRKFNELTFSSISLTSEKSDEGLASSNKPGAKYTEAEQQQALMKY